MTQGSGRPPHEHALEFAQSLADAARPIALRYFRAHPDIIRKADNTPVTAADREIEHLLRKLIHEQYPEDGILGEEYGDRLNGDYDWVLDPIDGTSSYLMGNPLFGTLIALLHGTKPVLGLMDFPVTGERCMSDGTRTRFSNGAEEWMATVSRGKAIEDARLYITPPHDAPIHERRGLEALLQRVAFASPVCNCYAYALLASGHCELVVETGLDPYDYLPFVAVVRGAGGLITDWEGRALDLQSDGHIIAAASETLLHDSIAVLAGL